MFSGRVHLLLATLGLRECLDVLLGLGVGGLVFDNIVEELQHPTLKLLFIQLKHFIGVFDARGWSNNPGFGQIPDDVLNELLSPKVGLLPNTNLQAIDVLVPFLVPGVARGPQDREALMVKGGEVSLTFHQYDETVLPGALQIPEAIRPLFLALAKSFPNEAVALAYPDTVAG